MARTIFRLLALAAVSAALIAAQKPDYTLKVDVPFVTVDVTVEDANGNAVQNLSRDAFELFEDGAPQDIRYFLPVSAPHDVLLLFDRSGSTEDKWPLMQMAISEFIAGLRPQDKIAIATFDYDVQMQQEWTGDPDKALSALPRLLEPDQIGGTNFYHAVEETLRRQFRKTSGRRALIVLTDGRDTSFYKDLVTRNRIADPKAERPFQNALKAARTSRIPIYFVAFNTDRNLQPNTIGGDEYKSLRIIFPNSTMPDRYLAAVRMRMEQLADISGGRMIYPQKLDDIIPLYQRIGQELGISYTLGYVSPNPRLDGSFHRIEARTRDPLYRIVQSREGYYAR
ncbi:MAG TPA: VWA domain-containing protein [Terriglobia bacterium]|jgi:VWFA-related protein